MLQQRTCLVIDDSDAIRRLLAHMMTSLGYLVAEAMNAEKAVAHCGRHMPDAVLLDWNLPDATGVEAVQLLRSLPGGEKPIILYCPIEYDTEDCAMATTVGANGILPQPFNRALLHAALATAGLE